VRPQYTQGLARETSATVLAYVAPLAAAVIIVPAGQAFTCTPPTHLWDRDGPVWCFEGPRVRLSGIATRELDGTCSKGHSCPRASGTAARDALLDSIWSAGRTVAPWACSRSWAEDTLCLDWQRPAKDDCGVRVAKGRRPKLRDNAERVCLALRAFLVGSPLSVTGLTPPRSLAASGRSR
jgi:hypothetical protein